MASEVEIIARLGHACGCEWARCRRTSRANRGIPEGSACALRRGHGSRHRRGGASWKDWIDTLPPTLAEWQAEWAREHPGEPGPVASWASADGRVEWCVEVLRDRVHDREFIYMRLRVGTVEAHHNGRAWDGMYVRGKRTDAPHGARVDPADVIELGRIMQAADGGTNG